jgi:hypothetical protein
MHLLLGVFVYRWQSSVGGKVHIGGKVHEPYWRQGLLIHIDSNC